MSYTFRSKINSLASAVGINTSPGKGPSIPLDASAGIGLPEPLNLSPRTPRGTKKGFNAPTMSFNFSNVVRKHIILIGDTSLNNEAFINKGEIAILEQTKAAILREFPTADILVTSIHLSNNLTKQVPIECDKIPPSVTHIILSVGGNDGRHLISSLNSMSIAEIADQQMNFKNDYVNAVSYLIAKCPHVALVLPYSPLLKGTHKIIADCFVALWRDVIIEVGISCNLPVIDLRSTFNEETDYANPIQVSVKGGEKIANLIVTVIKECFMVENSRAKGEANKSSIFAANYGTKHLDGDEEDMAERSDENEEDVESPDGEYVDDKMRRYSLNSNKEVSSSGALHPIVSSKLFLLSLSLDSIKAMSALEKFAVFVTLRNNGMMDSEPTACYKIIQYILTTTKGSDLFVLKRSIDYVLDLHLLLNKSEMPSDMTLSILEHFKVQSADPKEGRRLHVLSDIDDTLFANLLDRRFPHKTVYPGIRQFYFELNNGNEKIRDANVRFDENGTIAGYGPGRNITFLSARPRFLVAGTLKKMNALGLHGASILPGNLSHLVTNSRMAAKKLENFLQYRLLYPEVKFLFIGDNGQGDLDLGKVLLKDHSDQVVFVAIHNIVPSKKEEDLALLGISLYNSYAGAAYCAGKKGIMQWDAVQRVAIACTEELSTINWGRGTYEKKKARWEELQADIENITPYLSSSEGSVLKNNFNEVKRRVLKEKADPISFNLPVSSSPPSAPDSNISSAPTLGGMSSFSLGGMRKEKPSPSKLSPTGPRERKDSRDRGDST